MDQGPCAATKRPSF